MNQSAQPYHQRAGYEIGAAIDRAVDECVQEGVLEKILREKLVKDSRTDDLLKATKDKIFDNVCRVEFKKENMI